MPRNIFPSQSDGTQAPSQSSEQSPIPLGGVSLGHSSKGGAELGGALDAGPYGRDRQVGPYCVVASLEEYVC